MALIVMCVAFSRDASAKVGAEMPWTTYEAEAMKVSARILGPTYEPYRVETESSGQKCVKLLDAGDFVEFTATARANAVVVRYSLPDSATGGGVNSTLALFVNGKPVRTLPLSSRYAWLYGNYPFSNRPADGKTRNFYDEARVKSVEIAKGDVVRLQKSKSDGIDCILDLVDLEDAPPALAAPANGLSVTKFGAVGDGVTDSTEALRRCIEVARTEGKIVWIPAGEYKLTGDILVPSAVTLQGAGIWHTTFVGDDQLYHQSGRRVRFKLTGNQIHLADFAIVGNLNYRDDREPNDGIVAAGCADSSISRIWLEHTKVGIWVYNGTKLLIEGCRFRNLLADGVNLCVGTSRTVIENCTARGTGDDCFAIWPAASDQGFIGQNQPGENVIRRCTGQLTFLANGGAIYGGANNRIEGCLFTDISTGCGLLISTTFPTSDESRNVDNNFSGTTVIRDCRLLRCGGYDHSWAWRGSLQICLDRRSISGLAISGVEIRDSFSDGMTVIAPGRSKGEGTLSATRLEKISVRGPGLGTPGRHGLWVREDAAGGMTLIDSDIADVQNDSAHFALSRD